METLGSHRILAGGAVGVCVGASVSLFIAPEHRLQNNLLDL